MYFKCQERMKVETFVTTVQINIFHQNKFPSNLCKNRRIHHTTKIKLALSGPQGNPNSVKPPFLNQNNTSSSETNPISNQFNDFGGWSHEFLELCNAQLSLLMSTTPNLDQVSLFFRKENPNTGALEFVPLIAHSSQYGERSGRVWISSGAAGEIELEDFRTSKFLPGGIPAKWILPDYPFKYVGEQGGILMPDGGLCIPIEYNEVLAGSIVLHRKENKEADEEFVQWTEKDIHRADTVAKTIALGAALEGKWRLNMSLVNTSRSMMSNVRSLLRATLHQIRSPIQALVTFGHLLRKKLPPGDSKRDLARNMILESLRIDELLEPLDDAGEQLVLPEAPLSPGPGNTYNTDGSKQLREENEDQNTAKSDNYSSLIYNREMDDETQGMQLVWLSDILRPQAEIVSALTEEKNMTFIEDIDDDCPPVRAVERYVREAVSNLLDNCMKYSPPKSIFGLSCRLSTVESNSDNEGNETVDVVVWDTGYGFSDSDLKNVWQYGQRGSAAKATGIDGSGIGLSLAKELLSFSNATVSLISPLPVELDPRDQSDKQNITELPGAAFILRFPRSMG